MAHLEDEFGDIVAKARYGLGLSVSDVARKTGLTDADLKSIEKYERHASRVEVGALAGALSLNADALWHIASGTYVPQIPVLPDEIQVETIAFPPIDSNGYIVHRVETGDTLMIDPGGQPEKILSLLDERGWNLTAVLITHGHHDHVGALAQVLDATRVPVFAHPYEVLGDALRPDQESRLVPLTVGPDNVTDRFQIDGTDVEVVYCPGHTENGVAFKISDLVFTGDTLFAGSLGRAQGGPAHYETLLSSARRLLQFPPEILLFPGHGPATTVGQEQIFNPFLAGSA